ncbi:MAG: hypothetical protein HQ518_10225 [Rhodopirellula sp.]|nr:hypothetical protein [Rhodopirellula sp.]
MITPSEIASKASNAYEKKFLPLWIRGDEAEFFPLPIRANLSLDASDISSTIQAVDKLREGSKQSRGWGYTVHWEEVRLRDFGRNSKPARVTIDSLDDLLRLTGTGKSFQTTCSVVKRLRSDLPDLEDWIVSHVRMLGKLHESVDGLIAVSRFFMEHPWPDCYARQIPVPVDTKFVERHESTLRQWLRLLLPGSAIDVSESQFASQFGLRDKQTHRGIRVLDSSLLAELSLPFAELSLPLRALATLPVRDATVIVVENRLNLFTLPSLHRSIGIEGEGKAVTRLRKLKWLHDNRLIYWGDIDVDGFEILSSLRSLFPHAESVLMDEKTLELHPDEQIPGNHRAPSPPSNLKLHEAAVFQRCAGRNIRLEQEKVLQKYSDAALAALMTGNEKPRNGR